MADRRLQHAKNADQGRKLLYETLLKRQPFSGSVRFNFFKGGLTGVQIEETIKPDQLAS